MKFLSLLALLVLPSLCQADYKIAYNVLGDAKSQDYEVYIMNQDGSEIKNLTNDPHSVDWVYTSHNGKIFYISDQGECSRCFNLYSMDINGDKISKISSFLLADSWIDSRDNGKEFIVKRLKQDYQGFDIINLQGELLKTLKFDLAFVSDPAFSPDGESIVFRGADKSSPRELGFIDELYVANISQSNDAGYVDYKKLTNNPSADPNKPWRGYYAAAPRWQGPDTISFGSQRDGNYDIYTVKPDGSGLRSVTPKENNQVFHYWSDSGDLVFEASMNNHSGYELYKRLENGSVIQLTNDNIEQYAPVIVETEN